MPFDGVTDEVRKRMGRIRKTDTRPELFVRRLLHRLGFRFRLHRHDLPGTPDLVFPRLRKIIFVHGCFWHQHDCALGKKKPKSRTEYRHPKLSRNVTRDESVRNALVECGWDVLVVWECETKQPQMLEQRLRHFLSEPGSKIDL